jgi:hypothetical protein
MAKIRFRGFHAMLDAKVLAALLTRGSHALLTAPRAEDRGGTQGPFYLFKSEIIRKLNIKERPFLPPHPPTLLRQSIYCE